MTPERRAHLIKERALSLGFARSGVTDLAPVAHADALRRWLTSGMAGTMDYMRRQADRRLDPGKILPGGTRAVVVTRNYYSSAPPPMPGTGRVARYARGPDYHSALAQPLAALASYLESLGPAGTVAKPYCDAGPVPERELAQRAGLGWIGKNTMLINPEDGSFFFLAAVLTNLDVAVDPPFEADRCGTCRRCLDACPTGAFPQARVLDSRRCISYLTIEHRGPIEPADAEAFEDWVFGCDVCQEVCPWNVKFAEAGSASGFGTDPSLAHLDLVEVARMSDEEFSRRFGDTALARAGAEGIRRNAQLLLARREPPCPTSLKG